MSGQCVGGWRWKERDAQSDESSGSKSSKGEAIRCVETSRYVTFPGQEESGGQAVSFLVAQRK